MRGIWAAAALLDDPETVAFARTRGLGLGEGGTPLEPQPALANALGVERLLLKREDLNPGGSHKDRGLLYQVLRHARSGARRFVLSSSGNAAISAAASCGLVGGELLAFVSPDTADSKLRRLQESAARVVCTPKPINFARYAARVFGLPNLRGTQDPLASVGYRSLAQEMAEACPEAAALFTFASSGVSSTGLLDGYERRAFGPTPSLWAVQSGRSIGIVRAGDPEIVEELESPAGRLGIRNPPDADALLARLRSTGGGAVVVRSAAIERWAARMENEGLRTSAEGPAVLAAIEDVRASGALRPGPVIAVITGHRSQWDRWTSDADNSADLRAEGPSPPLQVETYLELRSLLLGWGWEAVS